MTTPIRQPITITDEGDGMFVVSCGDRYSDPMARWHIIGIVMEWLTEVDDLEWIQTADEHKRDAQIMRQILRESEGDTPHA